MLLVGWTGAGIEPRLSSLAFPLRAAGAKNLRGVDVALTSKCAATAEVGVCSAT